MQKTSEEIISPTQRDRLKAVLSSLRGSGIEVSAVISRDGNLLAIDILAGEEHKVSAPMYAAVLCAAEQASSELRLGVPRRVVMEIGDKKMIATGAGPMALMVVLVGQKAVYTRALSDIEKAAAEIKSVIAAAGR